MTMIRVTVWKTGFNKIQFGSLLRECCGLSLSEEKHCVDSILRGEPITVIVDEQRSAHFLEQASRFGAICEPKEA